MDSHAFGNPARRNADMVYLDQSEFHRMHAGEDPLNVCRLQPVEVLEQTCKHRAIVGQYRIVAILKQRRLLDLDLLADDASAIDAAAHHPIDAAVTMIGAAIAILAEGAAEFGDHDDDRVAPGCGPDLFGESGKPAAEFAHAIGEITGCRTLVDVGVPAADIDEAEIELIAHQAA